MIKYSVLKMDLDLDLEGLLSFLEYFDLVGSVHLCLYVSISFSVFLPVALGAQGESRPSQPSGLAAFLPHYNG